MSAFVACPIKRPVGVVPHGLRPSDTSLPQLFRRLLRRALPPRWAARRGGSVAAEARRQTLCEALERLARREPPAAQADSFEADPASVGSFRPRRIQRRMVLMCVRLPLRAGGVSLAARASGILVSVAKSITAWSPANSGDCGPAFTG